MPPALVPRLGAPMRKGCPMSKAIRVLAVLILVAYALYVTAIAVSGAIAANQGMPSNKVPDPLVMAAWAVPGLVGFTISGLTLALGIVAAISANRRRHRVWRVVFVALGVLGAPGPNIGGAFILGGLLSGPGVFLMITVVLGVLFLFCPGVLAICALIYERHPLPAVASSQPSPLLAS